MKQFSEQQVDDIIKLKFGRLVTSLNHTSYISNRILGKLFKVSGERIRQLYLARFKKYQQQDLASFLREQQDSSIAKRKNFGLRFLKKHEIAWLTNGNTLRQ